MEPLPDPDLHTLVALTRGWALCYVGRSDEGLPLLGDAVSTEATLDPLGLMRLSGALEWLDRSREGYRHACRDVSQARRNGAVGLLPYLLYQQAWHANRAGLLNEGYAAASEALALARELDLWLPRTQSLLVLTAITARRGAESECLGFAEEVRTAVEEAGLEGYRIWLRNSLGLLAIGLSDLDGAARELDAAATRAPPARRPLARDRPDRRPGRSACPGGRRGGRSRRARRLRGLARTAEPGRPRHGDPGARADRHRRGIRALLRAGRFRSTSARTTAGRSPAPSWPSASGSGALAAASTPASSSGSRSRSSRRQGADAWADRVRAELRASGETLRRRKSWEEEALTPQELQISLHVARGMTNREVGAALFLSHKTIEFHLSRIYRKLKMHSRAELIRRFAREAEEAEALPAEDQTTGPLAEARRS